MPYPAPALEAPLRRLLEGLSAETRRHGRYLLGASFWYRDHIHQWNWDWDARSFECKVPAGDSYRLLTVCIDLPAVGRPLRVHCNCRLRFGRGLPFPRRERCVHTCAALEFLRYQLEDPLHYDTEDRRRLQEMLASPAVATWNGTTSILDGFLTEHESAEPEIDRRRRLTWRLRSQTYGLELGAWEQKARGHGWTGGRKVAWKRLVHDRALWTTEADRKVVTRIFESQESAERSYWQIDAVAALRDLIGHPLVFHWLSPQPIAVEAAELMVRLRQVPAAMPEGAGGLSLEITLGGRPLASFAALELWEDERTLAGFADDGARILVAVVEPQVLDLVSRLGRHGRQAGAAEREDILALLPRLAVLVPVELTAEDAPVPLRAEARPRLFLIPEWYGLTAKIRVRPAPGIVPFRPGQGPERLTALDDGRCRMVERQPEEEHRAAVDLARRLGLEVTEGWEWFFGSNDVAFDLVLAAQEEAAGGLVVEWPEGEERKVVSPSPLKVRIDGRRDYFAARGGVTVGDRELSLAELLEALRTGGRYLELGSGDWLEITAELRARLEALGDVVRPRRGVLEVDLTAAHLVRELLAADDVRCEVSDRFRETLDRLEAAEGLDPVPPAELAAELRRYQVDGYRWLRRLAAWGMGGCLADDMGLGKTVQSLALLLDRRPSGPALVVAPLSVCFNWLREARRFAPALAGVLYHGPGRARLLAGLGAGDLVVTSYGLLRRDGEELAEIAWGTLILDEAQAIKNSRTKTARAARRIPAGWRLALTGTPIENHLGELWSLFRVISPGVFGSWQAFRHRFAEPIERDGDEQRRRALRRRLRPFVLRRTKSEVLSELPPRTEIDLAAELSPGERRLYEAARLAALAQLSAGAPNRRRRGAELLAALTRLRQLACHPALVEPSWTRSSAKLDLAVELLVELVDGGHRALVFSQFTRLLGRLRKALEPHGIRHLYLDGRTRPGERQRRVDAFQAGAGGAFLISLKAGGTGLNLTAADYVILLDPWWNPAVENQASDRAHRIGQTRPVVVYRLIARGTIEEEVLKLQEEKRHLVAGVLAGTGAAGRLSADELLGLIRSA